MRVLIIETLWASHQLISLGNLFNIFFIQNFSIKYSFNLLSMFFHKLILSKTL